MEKKTEKISPCQWRDAHKEEKAGGISYNYYTTEPAILLDRSVIFNG